VRLEAFLDDQPVAVDALQLQQLGALVLQAVRLILEFEGGRSLIAVDANFRETQLRDVRIGQSARLTSDLYGSSIEFTGRVVGVGAASGAATALIPAQNATGNWVKVVQRIPVRIALDPAELKKHPLPIGASMEAEIDTRD
jgi:membrane fusion protein (multidrug efflux system)